MTGCFIDSGLDHDIFLNSDISQGSVVTQLRCGGIISQGFVANLLALLHGTLVVGVSQTAALNRGRHLYSAGRPSRWALAHTLVITQLCRKLIATMQTLFGIH